METTLRKKATQASSGHHKSTSSATDDETLLTEEQRALHAEMMKIENQALYSDNNNRVTQRNYLLLGIFIVSSALLPLAIQNGVVHSQVALFYNIIVFFLMLLWGGNSDKMGEQNAEILHNERKAKYRGVQTRRAANRAKKRIVVLPKVVASLVGKQDVELPRALAVRWGKQYWGTIGLILSTDSLTLYLAGVKRDLLSIAALICTIAVPIFIRHERPMEEEE